MTTILQWALGDRTSEWRNRNRFDWSIAMAVFHYGQRQSANFAAASF